MGWVVEVSDNFDRADESPLGWNWTTKTPESPTRLVSNVVLGTVDTDSAARFSRGTRINDHASRAKMSTAYSGRDPVMVPVVEPA
jgi:hypothetical protein